jgi:hypothetical protein
MRLDKFVEETKIESIFGRGTFKAVVMTGSPVSKSYTLKKIKSGNIETRLIGVDENYLKLYVNSCLPLFIDATSSNPGNIAKRYNALESLGYDTALVLVNADLRTEAIRHSLLIEIKDIKELNDDAILQISKKMEFFYDTPVKNPIGQQNVQRMRENGWKCIVPELYSPSELKRMVGVLCNE